MKNQSSFVLTSNQIARFKTELPDAVAELEKLWDAASLCINVDVDSELDQDCRSIRKAITNLQALEEELIAGNGLHIHVNSVDPEAAIAKVRHDLRTPLNAVQGYSEMILEDQSEEHDSTLIAALHDVLAQCALLLAKIDSRLRPHAEASDQDALSSSDSAVDHISVAGRILVVDDVAANREILKRRLTSQGHEVIGADSGKAALELLHKQNFDLMLLDILMPEMDGYQVLARVKADRKLRHLPVIVISAIDEIASVVKCIEAGAEDYLPKPFDPTLLKARIGNCLEKKRLRDETEMLLARLEGELQDAQNAQLSMVPQNFSSPAEQSPVSIYASMQPAREVGGDLYDFFYTGQHNFWFLVGDVSDKGVASGMFMSKTVALTRSIARQFFDQTGTVCSPGELLERLNIELCELNDEMTFVTLLIGCLHIPSGRVLLGNAGHADAVSLDPDPGLQTIDTYRGRPLGIRTDSSYQSSVVYLQPEGGLFLYTDGVPDASDQSGAFFGEQRMQAILKDNASGSPETIVDKVRNEIKQFVGTEDWFDDITMLAVRWTVAPADFRFLQLDNSLDEIGRVCDVLLSYFEQQDLAKAISRDLVIVTDEVLSNTVNYGYRDDEIHKISVRVVVHDAAVSMQFEDDGIEFNPLERSSVESTDATQTVDDRSIGGLGIHFIRTLLDDCNYHRENHRNIFTAYKKIEHSAKPVGDV